jgi:hypothetical protein
VKIWRKRNHNTLPVGITTKMENIWRLLKKLKIDLSYDPAILLLGIYPKERESG